MGLDQTDIKRMISCAADRMAEKTGYLGDIDSHFGDGDHGLTIGRIAALMKERAAAWDEGDIAGFLDDLGTGIMEIRGGSAGPLYGTMVAGLGADLGENETDLDTEAVRRMFSGCLSEMKDLTTARVGDKTMMDALIPAVDAARTAQGGAGQIFEAAAEAAEAGAESTKDFVPKFGRARNYGDRTIGTPDAGAVSTALFFRGLSDGARSAK